MNAMNTSEFCTLLGILDDGWDGLSAAARERLGNADLVIGAGRTLELVAGKLAAGTQRKDMDGVLGEVPGWIAAAQAADHSVVVLATGDPLCHGIASWLAGKLGAVKIEILPSVSTLQIAFARFRKPWNEFAIASCHSVDAGEWTLGATPEHGLYPLIRAVARSAKVAAFTGPHNTPARIARALRTAGYGEDTRVSVACRLLLPDEQLFADLSLEQAATMAFPEPNVVLIERDADDRQPTFGREDDEYQQRTPDKGLITKQEARALSLAKLRLAADAIVWDIGAGSGSVGLEAARLAPLGHVYAIEKNEADAANARANALRFRASNYTLADGRAPEHLDSWPDPDAVFIGGSGGELPALIRLILGRLKPGGRLVMNFVTLENLAAATAELTAASASGNLSWDVVQLQASRSQPILDMHRMAAQNPVWIVTASNPSAAHEQAQP